MRLCASHSVCLSTRAAQHAPPAGLRLRDGGATSSPHFVLVLRGAERATPRSVHPSAPKVRASLIRKIALQALKVSPNCPQRRVTQHLNSLNLGAKRRHKTEQTFVHLLPGPARRDLAQAPPSPAHVPCSLWSPAHRLRPSPRSRVASLRPPNPFGTPTNPQLSRRLTAQTSRSGPPPAPLRSA